MYLTEYADPDEDFAAFLDAVGGMFSQVELYTDDDPFDDANGSWSILLDPSRTPYPDGTAYLAQWVGERLPEGVDETTARYWLTDGPNQRRGTVVSIARAAQRSLTGTRLVAIFERTLSDGSTDVNGDHFTVYTYTSQTPDSNQVWQDLLTVIPADMVCHYAAIAGETWLQVKDTYASWNAMKTALPTWGAVSSATPGASVWTR